MSPAMHSDDARVTINRMLAIRRDIDRFRRTWPSLDAGNDPLPAFTWAELERQLSSLSIGPHGAPIASGMIRSLRQLAGVKPPEMVLREILCMAGALMDDDIRLEMSDDDG